jgi:uncharacterized protein YcgI (DUF1989 family)
MSTGTITRGRLSPQTGTAFEMRRGATLRIVDPFGEQVADLIAFALGDPAEWLSSGRSIDYNDTIRFTTGHTLYSNRSEPMLAIVADTVGVHDFLYTPCSRETFTLIYKHAGDHPSCFDNLARSLEPFGVSADRIPTTFNVFMNVEVNQDGKVKVLPPRSRAGDYIELRAEKDLLIGLTACSAELSNNFRFKPIDYEIFPSPEPL